MKDFTVFSVFCPPPDERGGKEMKYRREILNHTPPTLL
jgi:hypothetical protein